VIISKRTQIQNIAFYATLNTLK